MTGESTIVRPGAAHPALVFFESSAGTAVFGFVGWGRDLGEHAAGFESAGRGLESAGENVSFGVGVACYRQCPSTHTQR